VTVCPGERAIGAGGAANENTPATSFVTVTLFTLCPAPGSMFWIVTEIVVERPGDVVGNRSGSGRTAIGLGAAFEFAGFPPLPVAADDPPLDELCSAEIGTQAGAASARAIAAAAPATSMGRRRPGVAFGKAHLLDGPRRGRGPESDPTTTILR
jgi:hypothetical protein